MNYRAEFKYHVMNLSTGAIVHSTNDEAEAELKAEGYATNSGNAHSILKEVARTQEERRIKIVREG